MHSDTGRLMKQHEGQAVRALALLAMAVTLMACGDDEEDPEPQVCSASTVSCTEQSIDQLDLLTTVSTGEVREEGTTSGEFLTYVDARAGGSAPTMSYTYARFTAQGLAKEEIDDQAALGSMDWDIAFRRFVIRVNSGVSGPSCVSVAAMPDGTTFESVTRVDDSWEFGTESYFTSDTCTFQEDEWGIGSPASLLGTYWTYQSCLAMTDRVFVVRLADSRHVKLQVTSYYELAAQEACNETSTLPQPSGAAQFRVRWAFLK